MLFSDAPAGSYERLLSPKRKLFYGFFAFGPGTILGLYLYSVKVKMERENEALRLEQVQSELSVVEEQQNKDLALARAIQEMRERLQRLEAEAAASRQNAADVAKAAESSAVQKNAEAKMPADESNIEKALDVLQPKEKPQAKTEKKEQPPWLSGAIGGSRGRAEQRQKDMIKEDVAAYQAEQRKRQHGN